MVLKFSKQGIKNVTGFLPISTKAYVEDFASLS